MKQPSFFSVFIGTGFGSGYFPKAPGTAGAFVATAIWFLLSLILPFNLLWMVTAALIVVFAVLGIWAGNVLEQYWGKDPKRLVVDEMVGVWIPLLIVPADNLWYVLGAFILFRFFDILKPLGIRKMESFKGGVGVMMDDVLAGIYSLVVLFIVRWLIG